MKKNTRVLNKKDVFPKEPSDIVSALKKYNIFLEQKELERLKQYHKLYLKYVKTHDLSRIYDFRNIIKKHYADSFLVNNYYKFKAGDIVLDIGTGAGFPGMMLAITNLDTNFILAEPRPRRVEFLNLAIKELNLNNVSVISSKIIKGMSLDIIPNIVITRALEDVAFTLERVKDFLFVNAKVIFMKGPNYQEDLKHAEQLSHDFYW